MLISSYPHSTLCLYLIELKENKNINNKTVMLSTGRFSKRKYKDDVRKNSHVMLAAADMMALFPF